MFWISRLNGVIWNICHSSNCIRQPTVRCPSSVFFGNRFRSADCQKIQLPLGGSQGEETIRLQQPTEYTPSASHSLSSSLREGAKGTSCQRAGQGTNVLVQALCVTVWRHCRPPLQPQNVLQIINSCANYLFSVLKFGYSMDIIAYVIFVIGKLNHWQISRLSEKQSYGAAQCGGQLQFLRDALPEGAVRFFCFSVA